MKIAIPVTLQAIVEYLFVFTDMAFVGRYKTEGLAAVNSAIMPFFTLMSLYFAIGQGATILMTQRLGGNKPSQARRIAETAFFYNTLFAWIYGVFWVLAGRKVLQLVGAQGEIQNMGTQYLTFLALQFVTLGLGFAAGSLFQAQHRFTVFSATIIGKTLLNIVLDWIMIFGKLGFPEMGVAGSALATSISSILGDLVLITILFVDRSALRIRVKGVLANNWMHLVRIGRIGIPLGLEYVLWTVGQTILIGLMNRIDNMTSGYFGVMNVLMHLSVNLYIGIGTANMMLVGKATGAKQPQEALKSTNYAILLTLIVCGLIGAIFLLFPAFMISIFVKKADTQVDLPALMPVLVLIMFPKSINIVGGNSIRGMGKTSWLMLTQFLGTIGIIATGAVCLFLFKWGLVGVLIAVFIDELWRGCANLIYYYHVVTK